MLGAGPAGAQGRIAEVCVPGICGQAPVLAREPAVDGCPADLCRFPAPLAVESLVAAARRSEVFSCSRRTRARPVTARSARSRARGLRAERLVHGADRGIDNPVAARNGAAPESTTRSCGLDHGLSCPERSGFTSVALLPGRRRVSEAEELPLPARGSPVSSLRRIRGPPLGPGGPGVSAEEGPQTVRRRGSWPGAARSAFTRCAAPSPRSVRSRTEAGARNRMWPVSERNRRNPPRLGSRHRARPRAPACRLHREGAPLPGHAILGKPHYPRRDECFSPRSRHQPTKPRG